MQGLSYFFLLLLIRVSSGIFKVIGLVGHNVTLPCSYDAQTYGILCICWGQGKVPRSKCSSTIFSSQDGAVSFRRSPRYQLQGRVTDGDVSLTILDAQWDDAGVYGCRVEYPVWFNDYKVNTQLIMEEAPVEQPVTQNCTLSTVEGKGEQTGTLTTFATKNVEDDHESWSNMGFTGRVRVEENFKGFLAVGNIGRVAAIFFSIIIILVFIFRQMLLSRDDGHRLNTLRISMKASQCLKDSKRNWSTDFYKQLQAAKVATCHVSKISNSLNNGLNSFGNGNTNDPFPQ